MISVDDYLNHWRVNYPNAEVPDDELTDEMRVDAATVVSAANALLDEYAKDQPGAANNPVPYEWRIASGWRPKAVNALVRGAAVHSQHCLCRAIDIVDSGNRLDAWINGNTGILDELDLWRESPDATAGWVHVQIVAYGSWVQGKSRTFQP